jgi:ComF family protein
VLSNQITTKIFKGFWTVLDWIYPPVCAVCKLPGYPLCSDCQKKIQFIHGKICRICGALLNSSFDICHNCQTKRPAFESMRNLAVFGGVIRECIHALKYENNRSLGKYFSDLLLPIVKRENWQIDCVLPVPLSKARLKARGYNQAAVIACPLALLLEKPYVSCAVSRVRDTKSQIGLSASERRLNVIGAFEALPDLVCGKNLLLVDDVMTTGSTMESCAKALKEAGAKTVNCVTIARSSG